MNKTRANKINRPIKDKNYFKDMAKMLRANGEQAEHNGKSSLRIGKLLKRFADDFMWVNENEKNKK
ncbi:hypothetical protein ISS03_04250 [Patescibacteria group bacterium]|nr:hypothetical protein [Patescibacteria group bacterium]